MTDTLPACPHRGRVLDNGRCFCRHPQVCGAGVKSVPVSVDMCQQCGVPGGGEPSPPSRHALRQMLPSLTGGPGTALVAIFKKLRIPGCQQCHDLALRMDVWGVAECRRRLSEIVDEIMPRAEKWAAQGKWKAKVPKAGLRASVAACVRLAIWRAAR